ncbi:MAG: response regulator [Nevskia sp.]|nr:response regulator [Nevskia sp.]
MPNADSPLIFVVDDDAELRGMLQQYLGRQGLEVVGLPSADDLLRRLPRRRPDLVVLDLMMPGTGGLEALRKLRADSDDIPLILLTARSDDVDRIIGLEMGADDYLGKPFNPRELLARIQAVLRRRPVAQHGSPRNGEAVRVGDYVLNLQARTLQKEGAHLRLTSGEFALISALAAHPMKPLSRERLIDLTRGGGTELSERSVDVQVLRLRKLIERDPENPVIIQTVRGVGYVFVPDETE